jgi:hypothetical protein
VCAVESRREERGGALLQGVWRQGLQPARLRQHRIIAAVVRAWARHVADSQRSGRMCGFQAGAAGGSGRRCCNYLNHVCQHTRCTAAQHCPVAARRVRPRTPRALLCRGHAHSTTPQPTAALSRL